MKTYKLLALFAVACATAHASLSDLFKTPAQQATALRAGLPIIASTHGYSNYPVVNPGTVKLIVIDYDYNNLPDGTLVCFTSYINGGGDMISHFTKQRLVMPDGSIEYATEGVNNKKTEYGHTEHYVDPVHLKAKYFVGVAWGYGPIKEPAQLLAGFKVKPASGSTLATVYAIAEAGTEAAKGVKFEPTAH